MTRLITSIDQILPDFDVAVLDQYGVLHNGVTPYPQADAALKLLAKSGRPMVVVSNSGKRSDLNRRRISSRGLSADVVTSVIFSGEALWEEFDAAAVLPVPSR